MELDQDLRSRQEMRELLGQANEAARALRSFSQEKLDSIAQAICEAGEQHAAALARLAVEETGFGNVTDKEAKNRFASRRVWEAIRERKVVGIVREDAQARIWEIGVPVGVVGGIVPSTNPTSTVLYKAMICLKAGNTVVFSPHPRAVKCTLEAARCVSQAAEAAGAPRGSIGCCSCPTAQAVDELLHHPHVRLILATGGAAMVRAAYSSGKPAIGVGAGNGPAYIHRSADFPRAVSDILRSKTFDNGTVCASEQLSLIHI